MKLYTYVSTAVLALLLGATAVAYAQQDEVKPPRQDEAKPEAQPASHEAKPPRQDEAKPPRQDEAKPPRQEEGKPPKLDENKPPRQEQSKPSHEQAKPASPERPGQQMERNQPTGQGNARQGNAKRGGHIPDEKFRTQFGRQHTFVVNRPVVVEGQPRFQYGGYWFEIVDPWPVEWAYTDDVYVDYVDGDYFLYDLLHPGVRIVVFVVE
jgi:hypothetical protein